MVEADQLRFRDPPFTVRECRSIFHETTPRRPLGPEGEFCGPCRAFMLEDIDVDPASGIDTQAREAVERVAGILGDDPEAFRHRVQELTAGALQGGPRQAVAEGRAYLMGDSGQLMTGPEAAQLVPDSAG